MRNSLIFKLMGAFLLVIAIGALVISLLTTQAMQSEFQIYTTRSSQAWAQRLAPALADFYALNRSWNGVASILQTDQAAEGVLSTAGPMGMGSGQGQGRGMGFGRQFGGGMGGMMTGQRLILADSRGVVVNDTLGELTGQQAGAGDLAAGTPVNVDNLLVGTLIVRPNDFAGSNTPAGQFLVSVNRSIVAAVVIAGVLALLLGAGLFFQITAPLRKLRKAAHAIAEGDLSQKVNIHSKDEFGDLGMSLNHMAESLEKAEKQRRQLAADISHELRTPLSVIQANLEGMLDGVLPFDASQVESVHKETLLLNRLVGDLRLLSLAEAGELKLERQAADPGVLINGLFDRLKQQAAQKKVVLEVDLAEKLPTVWIDADRIVQVLNNLVANALRYTPENGVITIRAEAKPDAVQVSVTDSGPGISSADLLLVFDRFYRGDKSRTRASGGSGLGLAIVRQLVEAHGGAVEALSPVFGRDTSRGYGTRITFPLPLKSG